MQRTITIKLLFKITKLFANNILKFIYFFLFPNELIYYLIWSICSFYLSLFQIKSVQLCFWVNTVQSNVNCLQNLFFSYSLTNNHYPQFFFKTTSSKNSQLTSEPKNSQLPSQRYQLSRQIASTEKRKARKSSTGTRVVQQTRPQKLQ